MRLRIVSVKLDYLGGTTTRNLAEMENAPSRLYVLRPGSNGWRNGHRTEYAQPRFRCLWCCRSLTVSCYRELDGGRVRSNPFAYRLGSSSGLRDRRRSAADAENSLRRSNTLGPVCVRQDTGLGFGFDFWQAFLADRLSGRRTGSGLVKRSRFLRLLFCGIDVAERRGAVANGRERQAAKRCGKHGA